MKRPVDRIIAKLGLPGLIDALSTHLSGADLTSLLLEVMHRRAAAVQPADLNRRFVSDRFVTLPAATFRSMRRVEDVLLRACENSFDVLALAPLVPLGTHSAMATVAQNKIVTTLRNNEVAADPTNALALVAAQRRKAALALDPKSPEQVNVAAFQRVVRAQHVVGAGRFAHFGLFGLLSAGRDSGAMTFERDAAPAHLVVHVRGLLALGAKQVTVSLTDFSGGEHRAVIDVCRAGLADLPDVICREDPARASGNGYYSGFCFKIHASFGGEPFETSDGGSVDWTRRLVGSAKERCFISGLGIDRVALASGSEDRQGVVMNEKSKIDEVLAELRRQRDELRLQLHLAKAEAKDEWIELEKQWNQLEIKLTAVSKEAKGSASDVGAALGKVAEELGRAYDRLKKSWR